MTAGTESGQEKNGPNASGRGIVLHPHIPPRPGEEPAAGAREPDGRLEEAVGLAAAIGLEISHAEWVSLKRPKPSTLLGGGVVERMVGLIEALEIEVVIVDSALTPVQQRNLERAWKCKVIDRTALILEIFGARARTHEGRLQVELASLTFQRSRLVRSWTHLERQRGGVGFLGGPGESQLEIDRRLISERITRITKELDEVKRTRELHRSARRRIPYPTVALVGYTNAGKSTLFNRVTESKVFAKDLLFATLDPTMRKIDLPSGKTIILSDTVGFISDLPTHLVAAFRATLEEVLDADLVLHVRDISHPDTEAQRQDVIAVLADLEVDQDRLDNATIEVLNKADLLSNELKEGLRIRLLGNEPSVLVSAVTGEGCDALLDAIDERVNQGRLVRFYTLDAGNGAALAWLHENGTVRDRSGDGMSIRVQVDLDPADADRFERRFHTTADA